MNVLLVEDNPEMLFRMEEALLGMRNILNIHKAENISDALILLRTCHPEILVCDLRLPDGSGIDVISVSSELGIPSLVVSVLCDEDTVLRAVESGASGYLLKDVDAEAIRSAIVEVVNGGAPITPSVAGFILKTARVGMQATDRKAGNLRSINQEFGLTKREEQILGLFARGFKVAEIADTLSISQHTVSNHTRSVYRKLQVNSKSQAVYKAIKCGLFVD